MTFEIFGAWVSVFLTLAIFSFLYKDNPIYKIVEHLFVGISAGYWMSIFFWTQIQPNLLGRLWPSKEYTESGPWYGLNYLYNVVADSIFPIGGIDKGHDFDFLYLWYGLYDFLSVVAGSVFPEGGIDKGHDLHFSYLIPFALGVMMLLSLFKSFNWMARWGIAYTVGMAAGLRAYGYLNSNVIAQVKATIIPIANTELPFFSLLGDSHFNNLILLVGTLTGLLYFYFSKEHAGAFGRISKIGVYFLMISFGASFGFAVMGRISLLIGRFVELITFSGSAYHHASLWVLVMMVMVLGYSAFSEQKEESS